MPTRNGRSLNHARFSGNLGVGRLLLKTPPPFTHILGDIIHIMSLN